MADNYIEKQQEQYEARKAAWLKEQKYGKKKPQTKVAPSVETKQLPKERQEEENK